MEEEEVLSVHMTVFYGILVVFLVVGSGLMSGLTLGLLSLDVMDLEVLRVSGTVKQQLAAARLIPLVAKPHWLLCTLLLCNAACMEALPLFLDRLLNPVIAILLSVTAILLFGEIIPQAVCSRYGVAIGSALAPLVRVLMLVCAPISWPLGKLLDLVLGHENVAMKRQQLKAMVQLHGEHAGLGGKLTAQEVSVISGAMDLRYKTAISAMTPLSKVFMVSEHALLDEGLVRAMLHSGHSRVPVYRGNDPTDFAGLILVKEVLQFWRCPETPRVSQLSLRPFPRLPADTPMFDMLRFFQTGNSHMALLTAPEGSDLEDFKRTRAFMMTHDDEDESTRSSCSSSSTDSPCNSEDDETGVGTPVGTRGSITSSIRRHLRKRSKSKCASTQRDGGCSSIIERRSSCSSSKDLHTAISSGAGCSNTHSQPRRSTCSCPCHHSDSSCLCGTNEAAFHTCQTPRQNLGQTIDMTVLQPRVKGPGGPGEALLPGTACTAAASSSSSSGGGASADAEAAVSGGDGSHKLRAHRHEPLMPPSIPGATPHGDSSSRHSPGIQQQQQHGQQQQSLELLSEGVHTCLQSCPMSHCPCRPGRQPSAQEQQQQQQHAGEPMSHPHHTHHRQHQHTSCHLAALSHLGEQQQQQQQQQQESQAVAPQQHQQGSAAATGPSGANHVALSIAALEAANSHTHCATHSMVRQASSSSSGSSSQQPGTVGTSPASARQAAAAAAAAAAAETSEGGAAAVGADEMQDKLGPLMTHSLTSVRPHSLTGVQQQQQLQLLSPAGVLSAASGVRQVPVGIITLEDVIEELMQAEIVDETDMYMDNDKTKRVDLAKLMESLPPSMLTTLRAEMLHAAEKFIKTATWSPGGANPALNPNLNGSRQLIAIRAVAAATAAGTQAAPLAPSSSSRSSSPVDIAARAAVAATAAGSSAGGWGEPGSVAAAGQAGVGAAGVHIQSSPTVAVGGVTSSSSGGNNPEVSAALGASTSPAAAAAAGAAAAAAPCHPSHAQAGKPLSVDALLASASGIVRRLSGTSSSSTAQPSTEGSALGRRFASEAEQCHHKLQRAHSGGPGAGVGMSTAAAALSQYDCTDASIELCSSAPLTVMPGLIAPVSSFGSSTVGAAGRGSSVGGGGTTGMGGWGSAAATAGSAGVASTRMSAPGVLYAGVRKPVAKVFKSAPSPLLSPQPTQEQPPAQQ